MDGLRYLLLQVRNPDDPMRDQEVECFSRELGCPKENLSTHDLLAGRPDNALVNKTDVVLVGGSGDYSVVQGGEWLEEALQTFRWLYEQSIATFASCWGFQAFARALGGKVVTDVRRAELGTIEMVLTDSGKTDPVFGPLGSPFLGQMGHQDIVDKLPENAILLASSDRVRNEACTFPGKPIYCTQFHPELSADDLIERLRSYPGYVQRISGIPLDEFVRYCQPTPASSQLLKRFVQTVFG